MSKLPYFQVHRVFFYIRKVVDETPKTRTFLTFQHGAWGNPVRESTTASFGKAIGRFETVEQAEQFRAAYEALVAKQNRERDALTAQHRAEIEAALEQHGSVSP